MSDAGGEARQSESAAHLPGWASAALLIAGVTLVARVIGLLRFVVLGHTLGDSCLGSVYVTANAVPNIVYEVVVGGALVAVVVPLVAGARESDPGKVRATVAALHGWALTLLVPVTVVMYLTSSWVVDLLLGSSSECAGDPAGVATEMLWVFLLQIPIYGATVVAQGALQAHHRFFAPAVAPAVSSVVVITSYLVYESMAGGVEQNSAALTTTEFWVLAGGTTLGVVALLLVQLPALARAGLIVMPSLRFPEGRSGQARTLAWSGGVVVASQWIAYAAAIRWSNVYGSEGTAVIFVLAWTLFLLPWSVLALPIATSTFPRLSAMHARGDVRAAAATTAMTLRAVIVASAVGAAGVAAASQPLAVVLIKPSPEGNPVPELAAMLVALAPGVLAYGAHGHLVRVLAAGHRAPSAAAGTVVGWVVGLAVAALGVRVADTTTEVLLAIGLGFSLGLLVAAFVLAGVVARAFGRDALARVAVTTLAAAATALVVGWVGHALIGDAAGTTIVMAAVQILVVGSVSVLVVVGVALLVDPDSGRTLMRARSRPTVDTS